MKLQKQPNRASCLITAVAMCLDIPVAELFEELDHDGTFKLFPNREVPQCYRGFHESEIAYLCHSNSHTFTRMDRHIFMGYDECSETEVNPPYIFDYLLSNMGVLTCPQTSTHAHGHAVAWDGHKIFDPNGTIVDYFGIWSTFYVIKPFAELS